MQILDLGDAQGHVIDHFDSRHAFHSGVARIAGIGGVSVIRIEPGGVLGRYSAVIDQLFCIIEGDGWVSGSDGGRVPLSRGQAALWQAGEGHESGTETGMTALDVEIEECMPRESEAIPFCPLAARVDPERSVPAIGAAKMGS